MKFTLRENKCVTAEVISRKADPFTIKKASFELQDASTGAVEAQGDATIQGHEITAAIAPKEAKMYKLYFIYEIADQVLVKSLIIDVEK